MYTDCGWGMYLFAVILCINCTSVWDSAKPFISFFESSATLSILPCSIPVLPKFRTNQKSSRILIFCAKVRSGEKWSKSEAFGGFSHARLFFFLWNIFPFGPCELCAAHQSYPTLHDPSQPVSRNAKFDVCIKIDLYDNDIIFPTSFIVQGFYRYLSRKAHSA